MNKHLRSPVFVALFGFCFVILVGLFSHAHAYPVIQEIYYDAPGSDKEDIFTEIYGDPGMSLDGWSLQGVNGADGSDYRTIKLSGAVIPSDGLLVIATSQATGDVFLNRDFTANVDWQNGPDAVVIRDPSNNVVDAVGYGSSKFFPQWAYEVMTAPDVADGSSIARLGLGQDTDNNSDDFLEITNPIPGAGSSVPIPGAIWLLGTGLIGLVGVMRKLKE